MRVWRLVHRRHADHAFDGEGTRKAGGRWTPKGTAVVHTAGSLALAAMEMLVHMEVRHFGRSFVAIPAEIPDDLKIDKLDAARLPAGWNAAEAPMALQELGQRWVQAGRSAVLRVPSAVIAEEYNYLLNPAHPEFARIGIGKPRPFGFDPRLGPAVG